MKYLYLFIGVIIAFTNPVEGQNKKAVKRIEYLKSAPLFISMPAPDPTALAESSPNEIAESKAFFTSLNSNIRLVMDNFWDLNSEINYISIDSLKPYMKSRKEAAFLQHEVRVYGKQENESAMLSFSLVNPKNALGFDDALTFLDSGFVEISTNFRLYRLSVLGEEVWSQTSTSNKRIVYLDEPSITPAAEEYLSKVKAKYRTRVLPISYNDLVNLILVRSSKHIMVLNDQAYYLYDGRMISLID